MNDNSEERSNYLLSLLDYVFNRYETLGFEELSEPERALVCVWSLHSEVESGGFKQFYFNISGEIAVEAVNAFKMIGAYELSGIIKKANSVFPDGHPPKNRDERILYLDSLSEFSREKLSFCDDKYYESDAVVDKLLFDYVVKNEAYFEQ
jgi:hypothetical protein